MSSPTQAQTPDIDPLCPENVAETAEPKDSLTLFNQGMALACQHQYEAAIAVYEQLMAQDPDFATGFDVYSELGNALEQLVRAGPPANGESAGCCRCL